MNYIQPKREILDQEDLRREFSTVARSTNFHKVMTHALAQFVITNTPNANELHAVRAFIGVLMNMHEADPVPSPLTAKTLDHSVYAKQFLDSDTQQSNN